MDARRRKLFLGLAVAAGSACRRAVNPPVDSSNKLPTPASNAADSRARGAEKSQGGPTFSIQLSGGLAYIFRNDGSLMLGTPTLSASQNCVPQDHAHTLQLQLAEGSVDTDETGLFSKGAWQLQGCQVEFTSGLPAGKVYLPRDSGVGGGAPDWNDLAWLLEPMAFYDPPLKLKSDWPARLGASVQLTGGTLSILKPVVGCAEKGVWEVKTMNGKTMKSLRAIADRALVTYPGLAPSVEMKITLPSKQEKKLIVKPTTNLTLSFQAVAGYASTYKFAQGEAWDHIAMFYELVTDSKGNEIDCKDRFVPYYAQFSPTSANCPQSEGGGQPTPGEYCPPMRFNEL